VAAGARGAVAQAAIDEQSVAMRAMRMKTSRGRGRADATETTGVGDGFMSVESSRRQGRAEYTPRMIPSLCVGVDENGLGP
jgi:hypothetical protein